MNILQLAQMYWEEYEALSSSFRSLINTSWPSDPQCPFPSMKGLLKATAVSGYFPLSFLAWTGYRKHSADVFVLAPGYACLGCCWSRAWCLLALSLWVDAAWTLSGTQPLSPLSPAWWGSMSAARYTHMLMSCCLKWTKAIVAINGWLHFLLCKHVYFLKPSFSAFGFCILLAVSFFHHVCTWKISLPWFLVFHLYCGFGFFSKLQNKCSYQHLE